MKNKNKVWLIVGCVFLTVLIFIIFVSLALPRIENPAVSGIVGVIIGSLNALLSTAMFSLVSIWGKSKDTEEKFKDIASRQALELTRMDYELRQKSLEIKGEGQTFLAPVKVYRELYKALLELQTTGNWPTNIYELGLLNVFELGPQKKE